MPASGGDSPLDRCAEQKSHAPSDLSGTPSGALPEKQLPAGGMASAQINRVETGAEAGGSAQV
jgi:hypothetical protein